MFEWKTSLVATKHETEKAIVYILEKELGVKCIVYSDFNRDELGNRALTINDQITLTIKPVA